MWKDRNAATGEYEGVSDVSRGTDVSLQLGALSDVHIPADDMLAPGCPEPEHTAASAGLDRAGELIPHQQVAGCLPIACREVMPVLSHDALARADTLSADESR
jgi:hypothetical protein